MRVAIATTTFESLFNQHNTCLIVISLHVLFWVLCVCCQYVLTPSVLMLSECGRERLLYIEEKISLHKQFKLASFGCYSVRLFICAQLSDYEKWT